MKLVDDWKECLQWFSVQAGAIGVASSAVYASMYGQLKDTLPPQYMAAITGAVFALGIVGRLLDQGDKS